MVIEKVYHVTYKIQRSRAKAVHYNRLKPYLGGVEVCWWERAARQFPIGEDDITSEGVPSAVKLQEPPPSDSPPNPLQGGRQDNVDDWPGGDCPATHPDGPDILPPAPTVTFPGGKAPQSKNPVSEPTGPGWTRHRPSESPGICGFAPWPVYSGRSEGRTNKQALPSTY